MFKRLGIFGGTFNPVHIGHCVIAEQFVEQMRLDKCLFVPTYISPFKTESVTTDPQHRLRMLQILVRTNEKFRLEEFEIRKKDISYTINTVRYLREKYPDTLLYLLIGSDQAQSFTQWKEWQEILSYVELCIARRPFLSDEEETAIISALTIENRQPHRLHVNQLEILSQKIRSSVSKKKSIRYVVPEKVRRYILKHRLYQDHEE